MIPRLIRERALSLVAFAVGIGAALAVLWMFGFIDIWRDSTAVNDFSAIWAGPHILTSGGDPYDPSTFPRASGELGVLPSATAVYIYPGWVAIMLAPLGALDLRTAAVIWILASVLAASIGLLLLLEAGTSRPPLVHTLLAFALLGSESSIVALYSGQVDLVIVGGLALMAAGIRTGHLVPAGIAASVMLLKPQLFVLAMPAAAALALARGERRFVYSFAGTALAIVLLSTLAMPHWWAAWLAHVPGPSAAAVTAATLPNAMRDMLGGAGVIAAYGLLAASVAIAFAFGRTRAALPVWLTVSLSIPPYLFVYDHIVAIVPLAMAAALNAERSARAAIAVALAGTVILVVAATLLHAIPGNEQGTLTYNGLAQFALTALIVLAVWRFRREPVSARRPPSSESPPA